MSQSLFEGRPCCFNTVQSCKKLGRLSRVQNLFPQHGREVGVFRTSDSSVEWVSPLVLLPIVSVLPAWVFFLKQIWVCLISPCRVYPLSRKCLSFPAISPLRYILVDDGCFRSLPTHIMGWVFPIEFFPH